MTPEEICGMNEPPDMEAIEDDAARRWVRVLHNGWLDNRDRVQGLESQLETLSAMKSVLAAVTEREAAINIALSKIESVDTRITFLYWVVGGLVLSLTCIIIAFILK